jgi:hypothetical protein
MGWLFAVALGLHRQSRATVIGALLQIALGHALSIASVAALLVTAGLLVPPAAIHIGCGAILLAWALYHWRFGHCRPAGFSMGTGAVGLTAWSFLMSTAHGAGIMLWPALMPSCGTVRPGAAIAGLGAGLGGPMSGAATVVGIHTLGMLATTALVALLAYEGVGLAAMRRVRLDLDRTWTVALTATAGILLAY